MIHCGNHRGLTAHFIPAWLWQTYILFAWIGDNQISSTPYFYWIFVGSLCQYFPERLFFLGSAAEILQWTSKHSSTVRFIVILEILKIVVFRFYATLAMMLDKKYFFGSSARNIINCSNPALNHNLKSHVKNLYWGKIPFQWRTKAKRDNVLSQICTLSDRLNARHKSTDYLIE